MKSLQVFLVLVVLKSCVAVVKRSPSIYSAGIPVETVEHNKHFPVLTAVPVAHPVGVPYPVHVPEPVPVHVPIHVPILKTVQVPVEKPVPYEIVKPYPVEVIQKVAVPIPKPYPVPYTILKVKHHFKEIISPHHSW